MGYCKFNKTHYSYSEYAYKNCSEEIFIPCRF